MNDVKLLWLNFYILALGYLVEEATRFIELPTKDEEEKKIENNQEPHVSDSEKKKKKQKMLQKEKMENRVVAHLTTLCHSVCGSPKPRFSISIP